jgi:hypothetical protein
MAIYWPISNGNWSTLSNWASSDGLTSAMAGSLPSNVDDVYSNRTSVSLDIDIHVNMMSNHEYVINNTFKILSGGGFDVTTASTTLNRNITSFILGGGRLGQFGVLNVSMASPKTCTLYGDISAYTTEFALQGGVAVSKSGGPLNIIGNVLGGGHRGGINNQVGIIQISSGTLNLTGNLFGGSVTFNYPAIWVQGTVDINIFGNLSGTNNGNTGRGITISSSTNSSININGDVYGGSSTGSNGLGIVGGSGVVNIYGNIYGGSAAGGLLNNITTFVVYISGSVYGGSGSSCYGVSNSSTGLIYVLGECVGGRGSSAHGIQNTSNGGLYLNKVKPNNFGLNSNLEFPPIGGAAYGATNSSIYGAVYVQKLENGSRGLLPTLGNIFILKDKENNASLFCILSSLRDYSFASLASNPNYSTTLSGITGYNFLFSTASAIGENFMPSLSDVRFNTFYDFNISKGLIKIPDPRTVTQGVAVDNTFGTAITDPSLVWVAPASAFDDTINTLGKRVSIALTIENSGEILKKFK